MSETNVYPAPEVDLSGPPQDKWQREYHAFMRLLPQLLQTHPGKFVAVHDEQVVDSGDDKVALALRVYSRFGYQPICIRQVCEQPPMTRIPSRRTL